ncbi:hypothetical protein BGZ70_010392 [Mortierella alpina]|uniref:Transmembrane protein 18 n=1 Tax=Mortierella alpina TaxID=64518 RepID=A0A9P6IZA0_MORAP|nr:hypothetical protein BGZ70_010392 [Mortierella alpina]
MASAETAGHAHRAGGPEGPAQFWDDFWNTLYQFTHPFSSTFFDSVFGSDDDAAPSTPHAPGQQRERQPGGLLGTGAGAGAGTGAGAARYFNDEASFEKFWHGLKQGAYHHESQPSTLMEHAQAAWIDFKTASSGFISSVEWQQTWIQMILLLHVTLFTIILVLRNRPNPLAAMLFCTILLAALSEPLNGIGSRHWQLFSDDNYFDTHGVFTGVVWAMPLLGNALLALLLLLRATVKLLIKVKKAQLQERKHKKQK